MNKKMAVTLLAAGAMLLAAVPTAAAGAPKLTETDDKIVMSNDLVVVTFEGKRPVLHYTSPVTGDATNYSLSFKSLVEYRDVDQNGAPSAPEVLSTLQLANASGWNVTTTDSNGVVMLNLTLVAPVTMGPGGTPGGVLDNVSLPERNAEVSLVFSLRDVTAKFDQVNATPLTVPASALSFAVIIAKYPLADPAMSRLALDLVSSTDVEKTLALGQESATFRVDNATVGSASWSAVAPGKNAQGAAMDIPVKAAVSGHTISLTYDMPGLGSLAHGGFAGLVPALDDESTEGAKKGILGAKSVPAPALFGIVASAAMAALALRRK